MTASRTFLEEGDSSSRAHHPEAIVALTKEVVLEG